MKRPKKKKKPIIEEYPEVRPILVNMQDGLSRKKRSVKETSALLGVPHSSVSRLLSGKYPAPLHYMLLIAEWLKAPPGWPLISWDMADRAFPACGPASEPPPAKKLALGKKGLTSHE
jgi:hypothetical protein